MFEDTRVSLYPMDKVSAAGKGAHVAGSWIVWLFTLVAELFEIEYAR
jgi:hypothetical protein